MSEGGPKVGFVGVGTVGRPIASSLLKRGSALTALDLTRRRWS
jgi:3-hydroxyisobutyrate dehydrogenase-like beta-hydroxyacid dehydrogenase